MPEPTQKPDTDTDTTPISQQLRNIPRGEPHKIHGQWYYRSRHSIWVLRTTDDDRYRAAYKPCWAYWGDYLDTT